MECGEFQKSIDILYNVIEYLQTLEKFVRCLGLRLKGFLPPLKSQLSKYFDSLCQQLLGSLHSTGYETVASGGYRNLFEAPAGPSYPYITKKILIYSICVLTSINSKAFTFIKAHHRH